MAMKRKRYRGLLFSLPMMAFSPVAHASECTKIASDLDRLACYDKEAGRTPEVTSSGSKSGNWNKIVEKSKLSDRQSIVLSVTSDEEINCGWNRGEKIKLMLRCHENATSIIFSTGCHMTSSEYNSYGDVEYRIDNEKSKTMRATESTDNKSLGLWSGTRSIPVIKSMIGKSKFVARMTPYGQNPFTVTFNIFGLDQEIAPLRKECGWE